VQVGAVVLRDIRGAALRQYRDLLQEGNTARPQPGPAKARKEQSELGQPSSLALVCHTESLCLCLQSVEDCKVATDTDLLNVLDLIFPVRKGCCGSEVPNASVIEREMAAR
jgi:hypothetical protein